MLYNYETKQCEPPGDLTQDEEARKFVPQGMGQDLFGIFRDRGLSSTEAIIKIFNMGISEED